MVCDCFDLTISSTTWLLALRAISLILVFLNNCPFLSLFTQLNKIVRVLVLRWQVFCLEMLFKFTWNHGKLRLPIRWNWIILHSKPDDFSQYTYVWQHTVGNHRCSAYLKCLFNFCICQTAKSRSSQAHKNGIAYPVKSIRINILQTLDHKSRKRKYLTIWPYLTMVNEKWEMRKQIRMTKIITS